MRHDKSCDKTSVRVCSQMGLSWFSCPLWSQSEALAPDTSLSCRRAHALASWFIWDARPYLWNRCSTFWKSPNKYSTSSITVTLKNKANKALTQTLKRFRDHVGKSPVSIQRIAGVWKRTHFNYLLNQFRYLCITFTSPTPVLILLLVCDFFNCTMRRIIYYFSFSFHSIYLQ